MKDYYYDTMVLIVFDYFEGELNEEIANNLLKDFALRYTEHSEYIQNSEGLSKLSLNVLIKPILSVFI